MADGQGGAIYIKKENAWVLAVEGAAAPPAAADGDHVIAGPGITITRDPITPANATISLSTPSPFSASAILTASRPIDSRVDHPTIYGGSYSTVVPLGSVWIMVWFRDGGYSHSDHDNETYRIGAAYSGTLRITGTSNNETFGTKMWTAAGGASASVLGGVHAIFFKVS